MSLMLDVRLLADGNPVEAATWRSAGGVEKKTDFWFAEYASAAGAKAADQ